MADARLERLLQQAEAAYQKRDKNKGAQYIDEVLRKDFNYPGAWNLLYRLFGGSRDFNEFRRAFALQYYPDKVGKLKPLELPAAESEPAQIPPLPINPEALAREKRPGFFARLFGVFRRKTKAPAAPPAAAPAPQTAAAESERRLEQVGSLPTASPLPSRPLEAAVVRRTDLSAAPDVAAPAPQPPKPVQPAQIFNRPKITPGAADKSKIHVVVVDDISQTRETIIRSLRFQEDISVDGTASNGVQAIQLVKELRPDVVVMDVNMPDMDGITATSIIKKEVPYAEIIILTVQDDVDYIRQAMNAGARDFLAKPPIIEELIEAVQRAGEFAKRARSAGAEIEESIQAAAVTRMHDGRGQIISVYSPRGGAGCTTLAVNLAVALQTPETHVAVVDGNLQYGDVAVFFNLQPKNNILDLAPRVDELDSDLVQEVMAEHSSGVRILATSTTPEQAELVTGSQFAGLLTYLSGMFAYVIVDTTSLLTEVTVAALDSSDVLILAAGQDIPSIWRMRKFLDMLPQLNIENQRVLMMMNRFDQRVSIDPEKVGQAFGHKIAAIIPSAPETANLAVNRGEPFMLTPGIGTQPLGHGMQNLVAVLQEKLKAQEEAANQPATPW